MTRIYRLRDFPERGRRVPEMPDHDIRELIVSPYRILYEFVGDTVFVLNIVHSRTPLDSDNDEPGPEGDH